MGLIFKGNTPSFSGNIKVEVPSATYSGESSANSATSINPYTNQGPGVAGAGLTNTEIDLIRNGQPLPPVHANLVIGTSLINFGNINILQDGILPILSSTTVNSVNLYLSGNFINFTVDALTPISVFGTNTVSNSALTITSTDGGGITTTSAILSQGSWTTFPISIPAGAYKLTTLNDSVFAEITTKTPMKDIYSAISADQTWTRPAGISSVNVKMWAGGGGGSNWASRQAGGAGGFTSGIINVTNHATLTVKVGSRGFNLNITGLQGGGWQDGGQGENSNAAAYGLNGGGGGGRSAIRDAANAVEIISAGGGGGAGALASGWTGNDNVHTGGLSFQGGAGLDDSGGGGGGFIGGLGGGGNQEGTGGQGYIGHADLSNTLVLPAINTKSEVVINNTDPDHTGIIGKGAINAFPASIGGDGLIIISYLY